MKNMLKFNTLLAGLVLLANFAFAEVTLSGSGSVGRPLKAKQAEIEAKSGQKLQITLKNSGLGLKDLVAGDCQLAMISGPLPAVAKSAGVDDSALKATMINIEKCAFVVNAGNAVKSLSLEQIKEIFTGKIANWKEVGGADEAIQVFILDGSNGPRLVFNEKVLEGSSLAASAVERSKSADIIPVVSQIAGAISFVAETDVKAGVSVVEDRSVAIPLNLVSKGEPAGDVKKVVDAAKAVMGD